MGQPIILLLFNAGPLNVGFAQNSPHIQSIMACFYPAQATGQALYNVITGKYSPAGRLSATWPLTLDQVRWTLSVNRYVNRFWNLVIEIKLSRVCGILTLSNS